MGVGWEQDESRMGAGWEAFPSCSHPTPNPRSPLRPAHAWVEQGLGNGIAGAIRKTLINDELSVSSSELREMFEGGSDAENFDMDALLS